MGWFSRTPKPHTGRTITAAEVRALLPVAQCGKALYAVTTVEYLLWRAKETKYRLSRDAGVFRWASTATCTLYSAACVTDAAQDYFGASFQERDPAPALAVFDFWFFPVGLRGVLTKPGHAIIGGFIESAAVAFVDVQDPSAPRVVTTAERASCYSARLL